MSFTASATIIAMTMSVFDFEFSEPGNTSAFIRHISN